MILLLPTLIYAQQHSTPYAGQQSRDIKALSDEEIRGYLNGQGMALAKAGELNHYPGPMHVLELADQLRLTDAQKQRTEAIRKTMLDETIPLGTRIVEKERELDALFAKGKATPAEVERLSVAIGEAQGRLRAEHLKTHLETTALLTPAQVDRYVKARGY